MKAAVESLIPSHTGFSFNPEDEQMKQTVIAELDRLLRMDRWLPSFQHVISQAALQAKEHLSIKGVRKLPFTDLLLYSREGIFNELRSLAIDLLLRQGGLRLPSITKFVFYTLRRDPSPYIRRRILHGIAFALGSMALTSTEPERGPMKDEMVVEEDAAKSVAVRRDLLDRASISGALAALRKEVERDEVLKREIWTTAKYASR
jgi:transcription initiation factor TFIID subunit 2